MTFDTTGSGGDRRGRAYPMDRFRERAGVGFGAYAPVVPGDASFVCQPQTCEAHCCHAFTVALGDAEVVPLVEAAGRPAAAVLESENGEPLALPLAQPYVLARKQGACALLDEGLACVAYAGRPNACRLYPHHVLFFSATGRPLQAGSSEMDAAAADAAVGRLMARDDRGPRAVLVRHLECPGFTGPALDHQAWTGLVRATWALQAVSQTVR